MEQVHLKREEDEGGEAKKKEEEEEEEEEKRRGRLLWLFVVNMSGVSLSFLLLVIYNNVMLRTLEKRFGLSSFQTGLLSSSNDIMQIALVVFIAYFGNKGHRPRIIFTTVMFSSAAGFLMASPHFFLHDYEIRNSFTTTTFFNKSTLISPSSSLYSNSSSHSGFHDLCLASNADKRQCSAGQSDNSWASIHPAFYIFIVAQFISGVGSSALYTLAMAYIDDNAPSNKLSLYLGFFMSIFSLSPIMGMLLAGLCLKLPENLFSGDKVNVDDPSFVGCWWLGYVIAASSLTIFSIPLNFFPPTLRKDKMVKSTGEKFSKETSVISKDSSIAEQAKDFPKALKKLLRNKLYLLNLCQIVCGAYTIYGMFVNMVRYIEIHFLYSATLASIVSGVSSSAIGAVGSLSGGIIVSRLKLDTKQTMKLIIVAGMAYVVGVIVLLNISCPQVQMDMSFNGNPYEATVQNACNQNCSCALDRKGYFPVCGSNGISYYSPCMAGCSSSENKTFSNCSCLRQTLPNNTLYNYRTSGEGAEFVEGTVTAGFCTPKCRMFIGFTVTLVIMSLFTSITRVPGTMITFNIVDDDERSFALGVNSFVLNLLGFIPAPLLFGKLIDKSCILWQQNCNKIGACLLFDTARLRYSIYGSTLVVETLELFFYAVMLYLIPRRLLHSPHRTLNKEIMQMEIQVEDKMAEEEKDQEVNLENGLKYEKNLSVGV